MADMKKRDTYHVRPSRAKRGFLYPSWWVVLFVAVCSVVYLNAAGRKEEVIQSLDTQIQALHSEKASLVQNNEDLLLQINSQSDPAWIQLTLMKGLGLVPEGQMKVYFYTDE